MSARTDNERSEAGSCRAASCSPYYDHGGITIYHGDCLEVMLQLEDRFDLCFTSPPYNKTGMSRDKKLWGAYSNMDGGYTSCDDNWTLDEYKRWQGNCLRQMARLSDAVFYNHKPQIADGTVTLPTEYIPKELNLRQVIIWDRGGGFNHSPGQFVPACEWIMLVAEKEWKMPTRGSGSAGDVWRIKIENDKTDHPCAYPVELVTTAIQATGAETILDPFGGSGTTARAAKDLGKRCVMIEKDEKYCEIAAERLSQEVLPLFEARPYGCPLTRAPSFGPI